VELCHPVLRSGARGTCWDVLLGSITVLSCGVYRGSPQFHSCQWGPLGTRSALAAVVSHFPEVELLGSRCNVDLWISGGCPLDPDTPGLGITGGVHPSESLFFFFILM
jgi:hypothetical protein